MSYLGNFNRQEHDKLVCGAQMLGMEKAADEGVAFQSRAEAAEAQRDAAVDRMRAMTPRPPLPRAMALPAALGAEGTQRFVAALAKYRRVVWPPAFSREVFGLHW